MMPHGHDKHAIDIKLVTLAGNEYSTQANLTHYDDLTQLEDDIIGFLPTVSDIEVFGCEIDLIEPATQLPLSEDFHTALLQQNKLQIITRPCMEEGHSIWQFQESDREGYPKAVRVPVNPRKEIADRAFYAAPMLWHVEVADGIKRVGFAAWQGCQQLQMVKLPPSVVSLEDGAFQGCYVLREVVAGLRPVQQKSLRRALLPQQSGHRQRGGCHQCSCTRGAAGPFCFRKLSHTHICHFRHGPHQ